MGQLWSRRNLATASLLAISTLAGCSASLKENTDSSISSMISGVTDGSGTVHAVLVQGAAPQPSGGPSATVAGIAVMINGGSSQQTLNGGASFDRVIVSVSGLEDYFELTLPAGTGSENLVLTANPDAYAGNLTFNYAVASGVNLGPYATQSIRFIRVGTGDVQISVAWDDSADVDLHVVDPNGEHIYFGHRDAVSGGTLDLDANAACTKNTFTDGHPPAFVSNENVVWARGEGIPGTYTAYLHYWSACGLPQTNWVATIQRVGAAPQIFTGTFVGVNSAIDTISVFTQ
jgi:hypothetical protein